MKKLAFLFLLACGVLAAQQNRLLVISIDGLDHRWLRDADQLGMKIPTLRELMRRGSRADGVVGIVPTVTWPSHTTIVSGVVAREHGILTNDRGGPGERWWYASYLKSRTLWQAAREKGLTSGAVWWPVTIGAAIDFVLPEFWEDRTIGYYSLEAVLKHSTPGLAQEIAEAYPSFRRKALTDRERVLATRFILESKKPQLMLLHLGELDSDQHDTGAFSAHSRATLEYQDGLLKYLFAAVPDDMYVAILADHGFENDVRIYRPHIAMKDAGIQGQVEVSQGIFGSADQVAVNYFRSLVGKDDSPIAREISMEEVRRFEPALGRWQAAFETVPGMFLRRDDGPALEPGRLRGHHGMWPTRPDFRASFLLTGPDVKPQIIPEISMLDIAPTFAEILDLELPAAMGESFLSRVRKK